MTIKTGISVGIAPPKLIKEDYDGFNPSLAIIDSVQNIRVPIRLLSVLGHSQKGHGRIFSNKSFPETTILDITKAIFENGSASKVETVRREVSYHIDSAKKVLEELLKIELGEVDRRSSPLYDSELSEITIHCIEDRTPVFGLAHFSEKDHYSTHKYVVSNPLRFLQGAYIASQMDSIEMRRKTVNRFPNTFEGDDLLIGGGKCHVANLFELRKKGISLNSFSIKALNPEQILNYYQRGFFIGRSVLRGHKSDSYKESWVNLYVREEMGLGCCDDATILGAGLLFMEHGLDAAIDVFHGAAFVDTVDTLDKATALPVTNGADEYLGKYINNKFKRITGSDLVNDETIMRAIYFGAKGNSPLIPISDSIRRFHQLLRFNGNGIQITPLAAHRNFLETNQTTENLPLGFERMPSQTFYERIDERIAHMQRLELLGNLSFRN